LRLLSIIVQRRANFNKEMQISVKALHAMVGASVQYTEPKLSTSASNWKMKNKKGLNFMV
jgi:hypothetical protein